MKKFLWGSVTALFLVSSVTFAVNNDFNVALQLLKAKLLFLAQSLSGEKKDVFDFNKAFYWLEIREKNLEKTDKNNYFFGQQINGTCMIWPWINLKLLETLLDGDLKGVVKKKNIIIETKWCASHRLWWGRECDLLFAWNKAFNAVAKNDYFSNAIKLGPVFPHVYDENKKQLCFHDLSGNPLFDSKTENVTIEVSEKSEKSFTVDVYSTNVPLALLKRLMSIPYFFADRKATEKMAFEVKKNISFFKDEEPIGSPNIQFCAGKDKNEKWHVYNSKSDDFEEKKESAVKDFFTGKISDNIVMDKKNETCGFIDSGVDMGANLLAKTLNGKVYSIYSTGLYKLILLRLGLNSKNIEVTEKNKEDSEENKALFPVISAMKREFNTGGIENPWSDFYMSKDVFLEYHLAEIFKKNAKLFEEAKKTCDFFFQTWEIYERMTTKEINGVSGDASRSYDTQEIKKYLPGPEQMMAMIVMRNVIGLWWGAMNSNAFYNALGINKVGGNFKTDFADKSGDFITFWKKIIDELKKLSRKHFVSFTSHGWVVSFDGNLINLQNSTSGFQDKKLLESLGIAGIESWHSKELSTFYKREGEME